MTVLGDKVFQEVIKLDEVFRADAIHTDGVLRKRVKVTRAPGLRKDLGLEGEEGRHLEAKEKSLRKLSQAHLDLELPGSRTMRE